MAAEIETGGVRDRLLLSLGHLSGARKKEPVVREYGADIGPQHGKECLVLEDMSLSSEEGQIFLEFAHECSRGCSNEEEFRSIVRSHVRKLLPHSFSIAVLGSATTETVSIRKYVGVDYPEEFIERIPRTVNLEERPVVAQWLATRQPMVLDPIKDRNVFSELEFAEVENFGLARLAIHGQIDLSARMASYFSFAGTSPKITVAKAQYVLRLIAPHLHVALSSIPLSIPSARDIYRLTSTETEILELLVKGLSNAEVAARRGRSESTIRNQLHALYEKLHVSNRAEAIALFLGA